MKTESLEPVGKLEELRTDQSDWTAVPAETLRWMTQLMMLIRRFEQTLLDLQEKGCVYGPIHTSIGQEGVAVGAALALRKSDNIFATHRAHHHYLAKTLAGMASERFDPLKGGLPAEMQDAVCVLLCEVMGLAEGCSSGRGGSMHLYNPEFGVAGTNAIVGGGVPHATGWAWADRRAGRDSATVCFYGDGAVYQGVVHEAINLGALWKAPVIYFIENNLYAVGTSVRDGCSAGANLSQVAVAYGLPGLRISGMDPLAVMLGMKRALGDRKASRGPIVVEAEVYRYLHHAGNAPGSGFGYRTKEEEGDWRKRDPIDTAISHLKRLNVIDDAGVELLEKQAADCLAAAVQYVTEKDSLGKIVVKEARWPKPSDAMRGVRGPDLTNVKCVEVEDFTAMRDIKYSDAIAEIIGRWMEKEKTVFVCGEEVANFGGGPYGATKGLPPRFPDRIINTPISESGFCGLGLGAALNGMRPIVEIMFTSFALVAADQMFNQIAQIGHIYGGRPEVPLILRTRQGTGLGYGAQHSLDPAAIVSLFPGWRIFVPTTPFDYIGLFNAAMKLRSPVFIIEHNRFYGEKGQIPEKDMDYLVCPGKAKVRRVGSAVSAVAYGYGVSLALQAAEKVAADGIDVEVLDLRTIDDWSLDYNSVGESLRKTGALVTVEQAPVANSIGGKIARGCVERFFDCLDAPPICLNSLDAPLPVSKRLEASCLLTVDQVADGFRKAAKSR